MGKLPVQYRAVLTLFYLNQATYEEIAEIMDAPLGTVKTNIHRARLQLRELVLADAGLTGPEDAAASEQLSDARSPLGESSASARRKRGATDAKP